MKKPFSLIIAGITAMSLVACGGADESIIDAATNDLIEVTTPDEVEPEISSDIDEPELSTDVDELDVADESTNSDELNEVLDGYESYVDDYIAIIKKQKADPSDMSIMTEYQELMTKGTEWSTKLGEKATELSPDQLTRMQKIQAKLASAAM